MASDMMTINISLPRGMYADAQKRVANKKYASVSELIRHALRQMLYPNITVNGFTRQFEKETLNSLNDPNNETYTWDGKGSFTDFMDKLVESKYGKSKSERKVHRAVQKTNLPKHKFEIGNKKEDILVSKEPIGYAVV